MLYKKCPHVHYQIVIAERNASFCHCQIRIVCFFHFLYNIAHSVQLPGGMGATTGGQREMIPYLARAAVASGVDGFFMEVHDNPPEGLSDSTNMLYLSSLENLLKDLIAINEIVKHDK